MGIITITHTRADGTLLKGSCEGDGVDDIAGPFGFRPFPSLGCLGVPCSRDRAVQRWRIDGVRTALEAAGWTVVVEIDEGDKAAAAAEPRTDPLMALRRIGKLEADRRRVERSRARCIPGSDFAQELTQQIGELDEQLAHWRAVVARAQEEGFRVWSRDDFRRGDFVQYRGTWFEVLRVNARSLTIPHIFAGVGREVVRSGDGEHGAHGWTWAARYSDGVTGRMSAQEMEEHESGGTGADDPV